MIIPTQSSRKSLAIGRLFSATLTVGLLICFGMEVKTLVSLDLNGALVTFTLVSIGLFILASVWLAWAARLDVSVARLKKNCPSFFKIKCECVSYTNRVCEVDASSYATRYLQVPTPPPRTRLARREAFSCR